MKAASFLWAGLYVLAAVLAMYVVYQLLFVQVQVCHHNYHQQKLLKEDYSLTSIEENYAHMDVSIVEVVPHLIHGDDLNC